MKCWADESGVRGSSSVAMSGESESDDRRVGASLGQRAKQPNREIQVDIYHQSRFLVS